MGLADEPWISPAEPWTLYAILTWHMSLFNFFKHKKKASENESKMPSIEQQEFSDAAVEIFTPLLVSKGFSLTKNEVEKYFTHITFRKGTQYIKL